MLASWLQRWPTFSGLHIHYGKLECSPLHSWLTSKPLCPPGPPSFCLQVYDTQAFC